MVVRYRYTKREKKDKWRYPERPVTGFPAGGPLKESERSWIVSRLPGRSFIRRVRVSEGWNHRMSGASYEADRRAVPKGTLAIL
ncbi:MAG: hypothetical protein II080_08745 [Lachnospiraceae bacterium]|nr:hypothetical protein [Lachnospiraceae bacterium]